MNIITFVNKRSMTYEYYIKQPEQVIEFKLKRLTFKNPNLTKILDRRIIQRSIRKKITIPF